jgi:EAL domain-containing protein (putative c-di-GMP-specific phosphodiesterase class I)
MSSMASEATPPRAETLLLRHVRRLSAARPGLRAMYFHLSRLQPHHRRDKHLQIAANMLDEVVQRFSGRLFRLSGGDLVVTCRGARRKTLDGAVELLRYLFSDDPLTQHEHTGDDFCTLFDLEHDFDRFLALAQRLEDARARRAATDLPRRGDPARRVLRPLDPEHLGDILGIINRADLSGFMRRQTVWSLPSDAPAQPQFEELFVSIEELGQALAPDFQLGRDRWLFQYLTQALDRRVLAQLTREYPAATRSLSLNVNVATLLSPEFSDFEEHLPVRARGNLLLELQLADIWSDFGAFVFIEHMARQRGYRLLLDSVRYGALPLVDGRSLGIDYLKLAWDDALLALDIEDELELQQMIARLAPTRVILVRCDRPEAVSFGQAAGITLFQGWYVDRLARDQAL